MYRKGLLAIGAGYAGGFFRTSEAAATPDVQVHFIIFSAETAGAALHPFPGFIASVCQLRPESRGFVRLKSADPRQPPAIQPRYLSSQFDRDTVVAGLKLLRRIMRQPAMRRYIAEERAPGPNVESDDDLLAFARAAGTTVFHPTSTCRMGADATAVVDERLRVRGVGQLARGRRLDHADGGLRQHQCGGHHDRREGRGHDPAGCECRGSKLATGARVAKGEVNPLRVVPRMTRGGARYVASSIRASNALSGQAKP